LAVKTPVQAALGYVASKAGLEAATRALARELAKKPFVFINVAPGAVADTAMQRAGHEHLVKDRGMTPAQADSYQARNPLERLATHEEVCKVFEFAIDAPQAMSGATLYMPSATGI
jgi:NAD(P)-dependent dehydrogenase (short-subunit alcohol dehydrogenase family)